MKHINKSQSPEDFIEWKNKANKNWQPTWKNFQKPEKTLVHKSLLKEQGFICCYCGRRINQTDSHIEHLKPRNKYPKLALNYTNLLASCQGCDSFLRNPLMRRDVGLLLSNRKVEFAL